MIGDEDILDATPSLHDERISEVEAAIDAADLEAGAEPAA